MLRSFQEEFEALKEWQIELRIEYTRERNVETGQVVSLDVNSLGVFRVLIDGKEFWYGMHPYTALEMFYLALGIEKGAQRCTAKTTT